MFKKIYLLGLCLSLIFLLAGCGTQKLSTYEQIQEDGYLTYAMTGQYPPFNYLDEEGELTGFDIAIANEIANRLGVEARPITTAWDGILTGLLSGRFDMIIGSMAITEERLERVQFSNPYYYDGAQFFALSERNLSAIDDIANGSIGVVTATTFHSFLIDNFPNLEVLQFESDVDNLRAVEQERVDGMVTGKFVGLGAKEQYGVPIEPIGSLLYSEEIAIAMRKEDDSLRDAVNAALSEMIADGTYEALSYEWFNMNILEK